MKCFECGAKCITKYIRQGDGRIDAVSKECTVCDWESYPVKIPESLGSRS